MISNLLMATGKQAHISTVDMVDPFGDGSGKALYKFDGDATDESGTYNGTASNFTYGTGKFGQCAVLNGTNSVFRLPYSSFPFIALDSFSFSIWIKRNNASVAGIMYINNLTDSVASFIYFNSSNNIVFEDGFYNNYSSLVCGNLSVGTWEHLVFTQQGDTRNVYQNGVNVGTSTSSLTRPVYTYLEMFALSVNGTFYNSFNGSIDQFRIFNRALTSTEVTALYNESVDNYVPYTPPLGFFNDGTEVANYKFDGDATDSTNDHDATAMNVAYTTGKIGQCAIFNGSSSYVSIPAFVGGGEYISFSMWIMFNNSNEAMFFDTGVWSTSDGFGFYKNTSNKLMLSFKQATFKTWSETVNPISIGSLFHLVIIKNQGALSVYINNALFHTATITNLTAIPAQAGIIGKEISATSYLNGSIDQFRIFNRAITATEITALYNEGQ